MRLVAFPFGPLLQVLQILCIFQTQCYASHPTITAAPVLQQQLQRRVNTIASDGFVTCTEWTDIISPGYVPVCYSGYTCLTNPSFYYLGCFTTTATTDTDLNIYNVACYNYPSVWQGASPSSVTYCSNTAPVCVTDFFVDFENNTYTEYFCDTSASSEFYTQVSPFAFTFPTTTPVVSSTPPPPTPVSTSSVSIMSSTVPLTTSTSTTVIPTPTPAPAGGGGSSAAVIGGAVGGALGGLTLIIGGFLIWYYMRRRREAERLQAASTEPGIQSPTMGLYSPSLGHKDY